MQTVLCLVIITYLVLYTLIKLMTYTGVGTGRPWHMGYLKGAASAGFQNEELKMKNMPRSQWQSYVQRLHPHATGPNHIDLDVLRGDIELLKSIGGNSYRFSVEWARVQPLPPVFDMSYYHNVCKMLVSYGIQPVITLFHFVLPSWAEDVWENKTGAFVAFSCRVVLELLRYKPIFITLNEPYLYALHGYMLGARPPFRRSTKLCLNVLTEMLTDHVHIYRFIKQCDSTCLVSIAKNIMPVHANTRLNPLEQALRFHFNAWFNLSFFRFINTGVIAMSFLECVKYRDTGAHMSVDFLGVNHYTEMSLATSMDYHNPIEVELRPPTVEVGSVKSAAGWFVTPLSWYKTLALVTQHVQIPVVVTECGVSNIEGQSRISRSDAMSNILALINTFPQVRGVLVWTLIDNIEWESGTDVRFGIFNMERKPTDISNSIRSFFKSK